jgi:hypothetical protein
MEADLIERRGARRWAWSGKLWRPIIEYASERRSAAMFVVSIARPTSTRTVIGPRKRPQ